MMNLLIFLCLCVSSFVWASALSPQATPHKDNPAELETTIRFASDATYPPLVSLNPERQVTGFETEVLKHVCHTQHLQCTFTHLEWDNLIPALKAKKVDAIYGGVAITPQRQNQFSFTIPLNDHNLSGFVAKKQKPAPTFTETALAGKRVGIQTGTAFTQYLQSKFKDVEIKRYISIQDALLDLASTRIDLVLGDTPVLEHFLQSLPQQTRGQYQITAIKPTPEDLAILGNGYGVAFNQDPKWMPVIERLNKGLYQFQQQHAYQKLKKEFHIP